MAEVLPTFTTIEQAELHYSHRFGMLMIKPDAVNMGVGEELIEYARVRMENEAQANLTGVFLVDTVSREDLSFMYPDLPGYKLDLAMKVFTLGPSAVLTFHGSREDVNLWQKLKQIRGKTMRQQTQTGLHESIRGILPMPGFPGDYRVVADKYRRGEEISQEEELILHFNLAHSPDTLKETAGLLRLISPIELAEALGEQHVAELSQTIYPYLTRGE